MRYIVMLISLVFLSACGGGTSPKPNLSQEIVVPADNADYFYALGEGETITLAKNSALAEISARILVSVSSSLENTLLVHRKDGRESTSQEISSQVSAQAKRIEFSGVELEQTRKNEYSAQALVRVDREVLFQSYVKKLKKVDNAILREMQELKKASLFTQLKSSFHVRSQMQKAQEYLLLLEAMKPGFDDMSYQKRYAHYEAKLKGIEKGAIFSISSDKNSAALASLIKEKLSERNIRLSEANPNVRIQLSTKVENKHYTTTNAKIAKMKIVLRSTTIKAVDDKGVVLSNRLIKSKAASSISQAEAISQTKQYERMISKQGILSFLSGNE